MNIHKTPFTTKNQRYIFVLAPFLLACQPQEEKTTTTYPEDHWGEVTEALPNFYAASDVTTRHLELTKEWHEIAANEWGNFGPLEFWIVGKSEESAADLDEKYCNLRKSLSPNLEIRYCLDRDHDFTTYAKEGNAGLNLRRNNHEEWSGFVVTMASKNPSPDEDDYKVVMLHEYFHVYQHAHIYTRDESKREELGKKNPWWLEGGAEYMAQLLYSRQEGVRDDYLQEVMKWKLRSMPMLAKSEVNRIDEISYGPRAMIAYDLGAWFIAYLINKTSEEAYRDHFFDDLNELGFEGSFVKNFGSSSEAMLEDFHNNFLKLSSQEKMLILPQN